MPTTAPAPPTTTIPTARPSQILRSHSAARWCREKIRRSFPDGTIRYCAIGRLADEGGFDWRAWDGENSERSNAAVFVRRTYGFSFNQITAIMLRNDRHGLDAVIAFLEARGK